MQKKLNLGDTSSNYSEILEYKKSKTDDLNLLDLYYLNNHQILSSWIGGPHGWCDWNGNINSSNYNIGKWPSVEDVYNEWVKIAEAFPFLDLRAQLYSGETSDHESEPLVEFTLKHGKVEMSIPSEPLDLPYFDMSSMFSRFNNRHSERGCSIETFKTALDHVRNKVEA